MDFREYLRRRLPPLTIQREPEVLDELAQHLSDLYTEARAAGLDHETALTRATAALPDNSVDLADAIESASRALPGRITDRWRSSLNEPMPAAPGALVMFTDLRRDLRYALRTLITNPGFAVVVALTIALGVGANAVIFSAVDAVLLRSAPVAEPDRVVSLYTSNSDGRDIFASSSYPDYADLRDSGIFQGVAAFASITLSLDANGETQAITGEMVSGNYFAMLGVPVSPGRTFADSEDRSGTPLRVAVVSHEFWQQRFGGAPSLVGSTISLNGNPYTVIGITPRSFLSPVLGRAPAVWVPMALQPEVRPPSAGVRRQLGSSDLLHERSVRWLNMIGRLKDGSSVAEATAGTAVLAQRLSTAMPDSNQGRQFTVVRLGDGPGIRTSARPLLQMLGGAVAIVLLIACANVAGLLLARAVSRRREVAVRMAVGAGTSRLVRQLLTESVVLAVTGGILGVVLSVWGVPLLYGFGIPETVPLTVNVRVLAFSLALAVVCGLLFGLAPALQTLRVDSIAALRDEGGAVATGVRAARLRKVFVVVQVALSLMLLVGAGLFLRTLQNAYAVDLGFRLGNTMLTGVNLDVRGYSPEAGQVVYAQILERARALPGVVAVSAARVSVLSGNARSGMVSTNGQPYSRDTGNGITVRSNTVADGYFDTLGIPLLRGRVFARSDTATGPLVCIVSRSLANTLWPGADPIGKSVLSGTSPREVVGVVADSVYATPLERNAPPVYYVPLSQSYESGLTYFIRTAGDPLDLYPALRQAVREIDSQLVVGRPRTLQDDFESSLGEQRTMALLVGLFGAIALTLAAVGLYGTMSYMAGQRRMELGIRLALGAKPRSLLTMLVLDGLRLVAIGTGLGLAGAVAAVRLIEAQLFGVAPTDLATFMAVAALLVIIGAVACAIPALRAIRLDPVVVLRN